MNRPQQPCDPVPAPQEARGNFEQSLTALQQIVDRLESGELGLDEALQQYEQGVKLLKTCYANLKQAERRVEQLLQVLEDGTIETAPFDDQATEAEVAGDQRARRRGYRRNPMQRDDLGDSPRSSPRNPGESLF